MQLGATTAIFIALTFPMAPRHAMGQLRAFVIEGGIDAQAFDVCRRVALRFSFLRVQSSNDGCDRRIGRTVRPSDPTTARSTTAPAARRSSATSAIKGDRIVYVGPQAPGHGEPHVVDASGKAVSPGFINMLSWATETLIEDGRGMSDTVQGVTLEVFGEGDSMGPWNDEMKALDRKRQGDIKYPTSPGRRSASISNIWRSKGVTPNVASFIGATTVAHPRAWRRRRRSHARATRAHARAGPRRR